MPDVAMLTSSVGQRRADLVRLLRAGDDAAAIGDSELGRALLARCGDACEASRWLDRVIASLAPLAPKGPRQRKRAIHAEILVRYDRKRQRVGPIVRDLGISQSAFYKQRAVALRRLSRSIDERLTRRETGSFGADSPWEEALLRAQRYEDGDRPLDALAEIRRLVASATDPGQRADLSARAIGPLVRVGRIAEAMRALSDGRHAARLLEPPLRARADARLLLSELAIRRRTGNTVCFGRAFDALSRALGPAVVDGDDDATAMLTNALLERSFHFIDVGDGHVASESLNRASQFMRRTPEQSTAIQIRHSLATAGVSALLPDRFAHAMERTTNAWVRAMTNGSEPSATRALEHLGQIALFAGKPDIVRRYGQALFGFAKRSGDEAIATSAAIFLASADVLVGRRVAALQRLDAARLTVPPDSIMSVLLDLSRAQSLHGLRRLREARETLFEVMPRCSAHAIESGNALGLLLHSRICTALGDRKGARRYLRDSLDLFARYPVPGDLCSAYEFAYQSTGERRYRDDAADLRSVTSSAFHDTGDDDFPCLTNGYGEFPSESSVRERAQLGQLTPRQRTVARLVRAGLTNREIAGELAISVRTVDHHVETILARLDVAHRWEIETADV